MKPNRSRALGTILLRRPSLLLGLALALLVALGCAVFGPEQAGPGGLAPERLEAIPIAMQAAVDRGELGGVVTLVFRHGEIARVDAVGWQDKARTIPMARDSIFRIASMTKPVTAVATLILVDDGKLELDAPVDRWLPELANPTVLRDPADALDTAYPSPRPITVRDLLTHRSGIVTPRAKPGPLRAALTKADANNAVGYDRWLEWIGELPLAHEPGSTYIYGNSFDVLAILIERASGMPYPDFVQARILDPLGMEDTAYWVPPEKHARMAPLQSLGSVPASWIPPFSEVAPFVSGAGGLYSTVDDYLQFARMLLGRGRLGDVRILSERLFEAMTTDELTDEQRKGEPFAGPRGFWDGQGFGLGVAIKKDASVHTSELGGASVGSFAWPGIFGTWFQVDPAEDMILVFMVPGGDAKPARWAFQSAAYRAIAD